MITHQRRTMEMARAVYESVDKRAQAARYLRELLLKHRDAARQRYAAPFVAIVCGISWIVLLQFLFLVFATSVVSLLRASMAVVTSP